jgi:hypothetical protein
MTLAPTSNRQLHVVFIDQASQEEIRNADIHPFRRYGEGLKYV